MNKALWVVQVLLALAFAGAGSMKMMSTPEELVTNGMNWANGMDPMLIKFIALSEILGALGLILPSALRIQPKLTPAAAVGLVVVMVLAAGKHISIGEAHMIAPNIVMGGLAAFVAWGRLKKHPILAK